VRPLVHPDGGQCKNIRPARAGDEAYALIREALVTSGDIIPGHGELLIRLDPLTARRGAAPARAGKGSRPTGGAP
jgi:hypothetical protein